MFKRKLKDKGAGAKSKGDDDVPPLAIDPFATEPPAIVVETAAYIEQFGTVYERPDAGAMSLEL